MGRKKTYITFEIDGIVIKVDDVNIEEMGYIKSPR